MVYRNNRRDCPRCESTLEPAPALGAGARTCIACRGSFLSHKTLRSGYAMIAAQILAGRSAVPLAPLRCPSCGETMRRTAVDTRGGDVQIDHCNKHGVWLDDRKLNDLLEGAR